MVLFALSWKYNPGPLMTSYGLGVSTLSLSGSDGDLSFFSPLITEIQVVPKRPLCRGPYLTNNPVLTSQLPLTVNLDHKSACTNG